MRSHFRIRVELIADDDIGGKESAVPTAVAWSSIQSYDADDIYDAALASVVRSLMRHAQTKAMLRRSDALQ